MKPKRQEFEPHQLISQIMQQIEMQHDLDNLKVTVEERNLPLVARLKGPKQQLQYILHTLLMNSISR
jgi:hypothetical protein